MAPQFGDSAGLRALARELIAAGGEVDHHTGRISDAVASLLSSVSGAEARASQAYAGGWDHVGSSLQTLTRAADDAAAAVISLANGLDDAAAEWAAAVSSAAAQGFSLTAVGAVAEVTAPALPSGATASQTSDQSTAVTDLTRRAQTALDDLAGARRRAMGALQGVSMPNLGDLTGQHSVALPDCGDSGLDAELAHVCNPILSGPSHFTS